MLPKVQVHRPERPLRQEHRRCDQCGPVLLDHRGDGEIVRRYAEEIGRWPQTIITGSGAELVKDDCPFVDNYVPHLVVKGIVLAYMKYVEEEERGTDLRP